MRGTYISPTVSYWAFGGFARSGKRARDTNSLVIMERDGNFVSRGKNDLGDRRQIRISRVTWGEGGKDGGLRPIKEARGNVEHDPSLIRR